MKVVSYSQVVPSKNTNTEKNLLLHYFIAGVNAAGTGDFGIVHNGTNLQSSEVAVIQGWQHQRGKGGTHLMLRQKVIDTQLAQGRYVVTADSNLFLYANPENTPYHYLRYSFNGVFPNTGIYCDTSPDPKRWQSISKNLGIKLNDKKPKGKNIVLCCQRNGGWSMGEYDLQDWIVNTVKEIRKYSDRTIIIRPHPGDKKADEYLNNKFSRITNLPNTKISPFGKPLAHDLHKAWAVVNHNSSSIVGPIIQGYPAFISDPLRSQCSEVSHVGFKDIENPKEFDREKWLHRISMFHWNFDELRSGEAWKHMRNYCQ